MLHVECLASKEVLLTECKAGRLRHAKVGGRSRKPPSASQLTPLEREVHEAFAAAGVPIVVVMNVEELAHRRVGHGRARSIRSRRIAHCR